MGHMRRVTTRVGAALATVTAGLALALPTAHADPEPTPEPTPVVEPAPASTPAPTGEPAPAPAGESTPAPAVAPGQHKVTYTITTTSDLTANIYYVSTDPPNQAAANDPQFMPMARTPVGPGGPWVFETTLKDPTQWAFVSASGGLRVNPEFHCEIAVDGQVVASEQGGSGVQCALRPW